MKQIKLLSIVLLMCTGLQHSWAQTEETLANWDLTTYGGADWGPSPWSPTLSSTDVTMVGLTRGSGLTTNNTGAGTSWGANGWNPGTANAAAAVGSNDFITFSITANDGFSLSLTQIEDYNIRRSNTAPSTGIWQYSLNGTTFTDIGAAITWGTNTAASGNNKTAVDLTTIDALQNIPAGTTVTIRIVNWGGTNLTGNWYFNGAGSNPNLKLDGILTPSGPLPLKLLSFTGKQENNNNRLDWVTAREKEVAGFEVERGTDGRTFSKVAMVKAAGNESTEDYHYSFTDGQAGTVAYYRLKMIDQDDSYTYSNVVLLHNSSAAGSLRIYPNPAEDLLQVQGLNGAANYSICDVKGTVVLNAAATNTEAGLSINISSLSKGMYFIRIADKEKNETIRFVKK